MTGFVDWGQLIWVVGLVIGAGGGVAAFLFWVYRLVQGLRSEMSERDSAAQLEKERAKLVEDDLRRELNDYKVHVAEKFATKDGVTAAVNRVEGSIQNIATQVENAVDRLTARIDKLLDNNNRSPPTRRTG